MNGSDKLIMIQELNLGQVVGPKGDKGKDGKSFSIKGTYLTLEALQAAVPSPIIGDMYNVGTEPPYSFYLWDGVTNKWEDQGKMQGISYEQLEAHNIDPTAHDIAMSKKANISSPNLWSAGNTSFPYTQNGVTISYDADEEIYTLNGTCNALTAFYISPNLSNQFMLGQEYFLSYTYVDGEISAGADPSVQFSSRALDSTGAQLNPNWLLIIAKTPGNYSSASFVKGTVTQAVADDGKSINLRFAVYAGVTCNNFRFKMQLEKDQQTPWMRNRSLNTIANEVAGKLDKSIIESGTWTPVVKAGSQVLNVTNVTATYRLMDNICHLYLFYDGIDEITDTGTIQISGLPFVPKNISSNIVSLNSSIMIGAKTVGSVIKLFKNGQSEVTKLDGAFSNMRLSINYAV